MFIQVKGRPGQSPGPVSEGNQKDDEILTSTHISGESSSDKENKSEETKVDKLDLEPKDQLTLVKLESTAQEDDASDEGWQEAVPKNRRTRPSLSRLNTNFMNMTRQISRSRGISNNFTSPRTSSNELSISVAGSTSQAAKKLLKSPNLNQKQNSSNKAALATAACTEQIN